MTNDVPTPLALSILALLRIQPMHPYEMQRLMREWAMDEIVRLRGGSLYSTINRLVASELIEVIGTSREGRRPERSTYRLTALGEQHLTGWVRRLIVVPIDEYPWFGTAAAFAPLLTPAELRVLFMERLARLEPLIAAEEARHEERFGGQPTRRAFQLGHEYGRAMRRAERDWIQQVVADLDSGAFGWPEELLAWQTHDPAVHGDYRLPPGDGDDPAPADDQRTRDPTGN